MSQTEHEQSAQAPVTAAPAGPVTGAELLTDGVVELRKRRELAMPRAAADTVGPPADPLEAMARQSAERIAAEGRPCA